MTTAPSPTRSAIDHDELRSILAHLSRELSQPLFSLRLGLDLLLADSPRPISVEQRGHVATMVGLCDDLLRLTRSYLDYAGLVQGTSPPTLGSFSVGALIREIDKQFAGKAAAQGIGWGCTLDGSDVTVTTDASRCQQIFGNLAANALKFTPEGGEVRVTGRREGRSWVVTVADDGPGIPKEYITRVFEPFFRLSREDRPRIEGDGLGLAICHEMVAQLGGAIDLQSNPGEGTRVAVRFPVDASQPLPAAGVAC